MSTNILGSNHTNNKRKPITSRSIPQPGAFKAVMDLRHIREPTKNYHVINYTSILNTEFFSEFSENLNSNIGEEDPLDETKISLISQYFLLVSGRLATMSNKTSEYSKLFRAAASASEKSYPGLLVDITNHLGIFTDAHGGRHYPAELNDNVLRAAIMAIMYGKDDVEDGAFYATSEEREVLLNYIDRFELGKGGKNVNFNMKERSRKFDLEEAKAKLADQLTVSFKNNGVTVNINLLPETVYSATSETVLMAAIQSIPKDLLQAAKTDHETLKQSVSSNLMDDKKVFPVVRKFLGKLGVRIYEDTTEVSVHKLCQALSVQRAHSQVIKDKFEDVTKYLETGFPTIKGSTAYYAKLDERNITSQFMMAGLSVGVATVLNQDEEYHEDLEWTFRYVMNRRTKKYYGKLIDAYSQG